MQEQGCADLEATAWAKITVYRLKGGVNKYPAKPFSNWGQYDDDRYKFAYTRARGQFDSTVPGEDQQTHPDKVLYALLVVLDSGVNGSGPHAGTKPDVDPDLEEWLLPILPQDSVYL